MSESFGFYVAVAAGWLAIGLVLSIVMGRRGHNSFGWLVLGTLLGPFGVVLAIDARRHDEVLQPAPLVVDVAAARTAAKRGPVDVLLGYDGSPESVAALDAVVDLLGERLGRLTMATVIPFGDIKAQERFAREGLRRVAGGGAGPVSDFEILHGHPSSALRQFAIQGGYELIAVGTRGAGIAKSILGSAASELARDSKVPVLLVGGNGPEEAEER